MLKFAKFKKTKGISKYIVVPAFRAAGIEKEANRLHGCGTIIKTIQCDNCNKNYFKSYNRCKSKYCPTCMKVKSLIWTAKIYPEIKKWIESGKEVSFATFTIKNQENLTIALNLLYDSWRFMTNKHVPIEWKNRFSGGIKSIEVKKGKYSDKWHPHIHALIFKDNTNKDYHFIKKAWEKSTSHIFGTDTKVGSVDIRNINKSTSNNEILFACLEAVKYMTKLKPNTKPEELKVLYNELKNRRQISTWGILRGINNRVEKEMDEESENEIVNFTCKICGCTSSHLNQLYEKSETWLDDLQLDNYEEVCTFTSLSKEERENKSYFDELMKNDILKQQLSLDK